MKRKIEIAVSICVTLIFVCTLFTANIIENKKNLETAKVVEKIQVLEEDKANLERKLDSFDKNYKSKIGEKATIEYLFKGPSTKLYKEYFPMMKKNDLVGVIAVSPKSFPGKKGFMSRAQFNEMLSDGWEYAVYWDGTGSITKYLRDIKDLFFIEKLTVPKFIYFKEGKYSPKYNGVLKEYGYDTVVCANTSAALKSTAEDDIWVLDECPILSKNNVRGMNTAFVEIGNIIFTIDLDGIDKEMPADYMEKLLKSIKDQAKGRNYKVTTISNARRMHTNVSKKDKELKAQYMSERTKLVKQIEEKDQKMRDIYYGQEK